MANTQYIITPQGKTMLTVGDHLIYLANSVAKDGVVSREELVESAGLTPAEADHTISVLSRLRWITPAPIQGVKYKDNSRRN